MPYRKTPSQMTWAEAFEDHRKYVNQKELEQQIINHLDNYSGNPKWTKLTRDQQDDHYEILFQIL
jgi:hypothetical protein